MGRISLEGMEFFSYHGCFREEQIIGGHFIIDVSFCTDTREAELSDDLSKTVNYQEVYDLVLAEMKVKSKLLEHVAGRIKASILKQFSGISGITVKVSKINPALGGKVNCVSVKIDDDE